MPTVGARVGAVIPSLVGFDLRGQRLSANLSGGKSETLILGLSGSCVYCIEMLDVHAAIVTGVSGQSSANA